ncbi:MAG TPA: cell envelope integrity protein TolA [Burkholderiaceae bacterium]|jgi:colicin import membrane protein|nr:cell envelope integrity protein TolA [Burkholderiaceae bacterium]
MTSPSILQNPIDRPPREERLGAGTTLSLLAHAALVSALVWGVHWRTKPTAEGSSAELWAAVPQIAAPPPTEVPATPPPAPARSPAPAPAPAPEPAPAPVPKPPDIVSEQEKARKLEQQQRQQAEQAAAQKEAQDKARADAQKQQQLDQQKQAQADQQKLAKLRQEQLARVMGQLGAPPDSTGNDARNAGPSASYMGRVIGLLHSNIFFSGDKSNNPAVEVDIRCAPDGTIISRRIVKSSGQQDWDDAVLRAIDRTRTLPRDVDGKTPTFIPIVWHPND